LPPWRKNIHADTGRQRIHRGHHPLPGANRVKDIFFYAIRTGGGADCRGGKTSARQQRSDDHLTP
jgi:hypothetical protein